MNAILACQWPKVSVSPADFHSVLTMQHNIAGTDSQSVHQQEDHREPRNQISQDERNIGLSINPGKRFTCCFFACTEIQTAIEILERNIHQDDHNHSETDMTLASAECKRIFWCFCSSTDYAVVDDADGADTQPAHHEKDHN